MLDPESEACVGDYAVSVLGGPRSGNSPGGARTRRSRPRSRRRSCASGDDRDGELRASLGGCSRCSRGFGSAPDRTSFGLLLSRARVSRRPLRLHPARQAMRWWPDPSSSPSSPRDGRKVLCLPLLLLPRPLHTIEGADSVRPADRGGALLPLRQWATGATSCCRAPFRTDDGLAPGDRPRAGGVVAASSSSAPAESGSS